MAWYKSGCISLLNLPLFHSSREIEELGKITTRILNLRNKNPNDTALHLRHLPLFTGFAIDRDQPEQQIIEYYLWFSFIAI